MALGAVCVLVAAAAGWWMTHRGAAPGSRGSETTLAVLPFQNLGSDSSADYLRFALPDEIATTLSYTPSLAIRPFAATRKYADSNFDPQAAGRELHVASIITGHYLREGERLQVTLEAIDVESDRVLWRDTVSAAAQEMIGLEDQISNRVRQGLLPALGASSRPGEAESRPKNAEAYSLYLRSLALAHDGAANRQAIAMLEQAVGLDPTYARAWDVLGSRYYFDASYGDGGEAAYRRGEEAHQRARSVDPDLLSAARSLVVIDTESGQLNTAYDTAAEMVRRRPDNADAHFALSYVLRYGGLLDDSARECDVVRALDPANYTFRSCAVPFIELGKFDRALDFVRTDAGSAWSTDFEWEIDVRQGKYQEALRTLVQAPPPARDPARQACSEHRPAAEIESRFRNEVDRVSAGRDSESRFWTAADLAFCGQREPALRILQRSVELGYCCYPAVDTNPLLAGIRNAPEFAGIRTAAIECQKKFVAHRDQQRGSGARL